MYHNVNILSILICTELKVDFLCRVILLWMRSRAMFFVKIYYYSMIKKC